MAPTPAVITPGIAGTPPNSINAHPVHRLFAIKPPKGKITTVQKTKLIVPATQSNPKLSKETETSFEIRVPAP